MMRAGLSRICGHQNDGPNSITISQHCLAKVFHSNQCLVQSLEPDGALTLELPLPNPERQETFSRFVNGLKAAIATPESLSDPNHMPGTSLSGVPVVLFYFDSLHHRKILECEVLTRPQAGKSDPNFWKTGHTCK